MKITNLFGQRNAIAIIVSCAAMAVVAACGSESTPAESSEPTATSTNVNSGSSTSGSQSGLVFQVNGDSEATFTVNEKLSRLPAPSDAVLRTSAISGEVRLDGQDFNIEIDLHGLSSDQSQRDRYVRDQLFPGQPVATIRFDGIASVPDGLLAGDEITATATGTVNVNGTDAQIEFEIESRLDGDVLFVLGRADFVWADFGMTAPVSQLFVVEDDVRVEVLLATQRL